MDENTGGWGHINVDQFTFADAPALPRSTETAVNLLVGGEVVRTATGANSETLDWSSWNLRDLIGSTAQIQIVDRNTGGWGHILADHFSFAAAPAQSVAPAQQLGRLRQGLLRGGDLERRPGRPPDLDRLDEQLELRRRDPDGAVAQRDERPARARPAHDRRHAAARPTAGAGAPPAARPVARLPRAAAAHSGRHDRTADPRRGARDQGDAPVGTAERAGLKVRTGDGEETVVGYDATTGELYVDRTRAGESSFSRDFAAAVQRAPLAPRNGRVRLRILVDWSSVEVFAERGERVITDQIFPAANSDGLQLFAEGGHAALERLRVWRMRSIWR